MRQRSNRKSLRAAVASVSACMALLFGADASADTFTSARIGGGPSRYKARGLDASTSSNQGTLRYGYTNQTLMAGIDATAYMFKSAPQANIFHRLQGNNILLFIGTTLDEWSFWLGAGAGQIRIFDRPSPAADDPHRYLTTEQNIGMSYDFYRATYGKIEGCLNWRRLTPEKDWQNLYGISKIEAWQFELGFKLINW